MRLRSGPGAIHAKLAAELTASAVSHARAMRCTRDPRERARLRFIASTKGLLASLHDRDAELSDRLVESILGGAR